MFAMYKGQLAKILFTLEIEFSDCIQRFYTVMKQILPLAKDDFAVDSRFASST